MLNTENLLGGETLRRLEDATAIQSVLLRRIEEVLSRGRKEGVFKSNINPVDLYILIASVCWFPISNMYTLREVFEAPIGREWLENHTEKASKMIVGYLRSGD